MLDQRPVVSATAPWAPAAALPRLAAVEAGLPADPEALLAHATAGAAEHLRRVDEDVLQLYAGTNAVPPSAGTEGLAAQASMGYPGAKFQAGLEDLDTAEVAVTRLVAGVMGAAYADVRPTSATVANLAVYTALTEPGDTIAVLPDWAGGHLSHHAVGAAGVRGLRVAALPYDADALDVDVDALPAMLERERPRLVVVGASLMLRPHRVAAIAEAAHAAGAHLLYDASHVSGLIAEHRFQAPLADGADVMTFSTYKSFGGPAGGAIVADDAALMARITTAVYPGLLANYDPSRLIPLGTAALARHRSAGTYADRCIAAARRLGAELHARGVAVVGEAHGFTESHHLALDASRLGGGTAAALRLAEAGVLSSEIGSPVSGDPAGAVRFGTQALVSQGFTPDDMADVAVVVAAALREDADLAALRADAAALRRHYPAGR